MVGQKLLRSLTLGATAIGALALAAPAYAEVDAVVTQALDLHRAGKAEEAYRLLLPLADRRAGDPDFDYALGLAAADSGHHGEAILAFQRVLAKNPNSAEARAEIARVYALSGDVDTARAVRHRVAGPHPARSGAPALHADGQGLRPPDRRRR